MSQQPNIDPLKSRVGRQIYAFAALLAALPLIVVGAYSLFEIDAAYREQAQKTLDQSILSFGEMLREKFLQSNELAERMIGERLTASELPTAFLNYAVIENGAAVHSTFPEALIPEIDRAGEANQPNISISQSQPDSSVYLAVNSNESTFIGELNPFHLWADRSLYPYATEFCILLQSMPAPVFCSTALPAEQQDIISQADTTSGSIEWSAADESWHSSYRELFLPAAFDAAPLRIVGSQPNDVTYSAAAAFRQVYIPGMALALAFALLGASIHARQFLRPLSALLAVTKRFADRDFTAVAHLERRDEFQDLANALNGMGIALDRQFKAHEAMSRLDQLILEGDSIEDVFRTSVAEAFVYMPLEIVELDIAADSDGQCVRYSLVRSEDCLRKDLVDSSEITPRPDMKQLNAGIVVAEERRGEIRGYTHEDSEAGPVTATQLNALADRISIALEFHEQSAELNRRAWYDELTGLPNRASCLHKINRAIETAECNGHMVALLYIDLDGFKSVNDSLGHETGDQLIRLAAERITACIGHHGVTARLGGDEFAVIFPYSKGRSEEYKAIGKMILMRLQEPFKLGNSEAFLGASIGAARYPEDGSTHTELLRKADAAMYRAKDSGRGRQVDYSRTLGIVIAKRLRLEADLNRALERDELQLVFQPQIDLRSRAMVSAEALLRWIHATEGPISTEEFIPIAEETNQIITLGNWVLFNACAQFSEWRDRGVNLQRIAVNVSAKQLRSPDFISHVKECLNQFSLSPEMLEIELTEGVFVGSPEIISSIHSLKLLGVEISIDDFGTGYSSLGYLKNLEFDKVKVDRSFVGSLPHDRQSASIIQAVLAMCRTLGKPVVAEGVETSQQLQYLTDAGVEFAQGHYFGQPMSAQEFEHAARTAQENDSTIVRFSGPRYR